MNKKAIKNIADYNEIASKVKAGDTVFLLECVEGDEWWKGEVAGSGSVGLFPSAYVKKD